jgi:lipoate-protein ligase A
MLYLDHTLPHLEANLALDEALLLAAEESEIGPILRLWESPVFAVVLGASSRLREDVYTDICQAEGVAIGRRSSGGGTVVIGPGALNVTVVLSRESGPGLHAVDTAQHFVLERIATSLRQHDPRVQVLGSGDLTTDRRKFAGSAQRRLRHHFLVHVSILYNFPLERIGRYTALPKRQPRYREGRTHQDFLVNLTLPRNALLEAILNAWLSGPEPAELSELPTERVRELVRTKFGDPAWVYRL